MLPALDRSREIPRFSLPTAVPGRRGFPISKRIFDIGVIVFFLPILIPVALLASILLLILEGRPLMYFATRSGQGGRVFSLIKFRTMRPTCDAKNIGVTGGSKGARVSHFCWLLRRSRVDELPQVLNVLRGDMSLVGPRPPDPRYVEKYPEIYQQILRSRPGITGLATLHMHRFEDKVLRRCETAEATETAYCVQCIPRKARLDRIYQDNWHCAGGILFDALIMLKSICAVLKRHR